MTSFGELFNYWASKLLHTQKAPVIGKESSFNLSSAKRQESCCLNFMGFSFLIWRVDKEEQKEILYLNVLTKWEVHFENKWNHRQILPYTDSAISADSHYFGIIMKFSRSLFLLRLLCCPHSPIWLHHFWKCPQPPFLLHSLGGGFNDPEGSRNT